MADKPLNRLFFGLYRNTGNDATRVVKDPVGYFSCRANVARFLDIEDKAVIDFLQKDRKEYTRIKTLADGTALGGTDAKVAAGKYTLTPTVGSKGIILTTGKKTIETPVAGKAINYHTLSFRFPQWADARTIAEALGELITPTKIKLTPTASDIFPYFQITGGRKFPIIEQSAAKGSDVAGIATTDAEKEALAAKQNAVRLKGAGQ